MFNGSCYAAVLLLRQVFQLRVQWVFKPARWKEQLSLYRRMVNTTVMLTQRVKITGSYTATNCLLFNGDNPLLCGAVAAGRLCQKVTFFFVAANSYILVGRLYGPITADLTHTHICMHMSGKGGVQQYPSSGEEEVQQYTICKIHWGGGGPTI